MYWYVTGIAARLRFLRVSSGLSVPEVGPAGVIPATLALLQANVVPVVALAGA